RVNGRSSLTASSRSRQMPGSLPRCVCVCVCVYVYVCVCVGVYTSEYLSVCQCLEGYLTVDEIQYRSDVTLHIHPSLISNLSDNPSQIMWHNSVTFSKIPQDFSVSCLR